MKKRVFVIILVILLLSTSVYAYSFKEFLQDFNDFFTGKVVGNNVDEDVIKCESNYLDNYKCVDNKLLREYKKEDCSLVYVDYMYCNYGCSDGKCKEKVVEVVSSPDVVESGVDVPVTEEIVGDEFQIAQLVVYGYLSVASLEQNYLVGEQVNLTDPPVEEKEGFFSKLVEGIKKIFKGKGIKKKIFEKNRESFFKGVGSSEFFGSQIDFIEQSKNFDNFVYANWTNYTKPIFKGYIIKYKEKSVGEKRVELLDKKEINIDQDLLDYRT